MKDRKRFILLSIIDMILLASSFLISLWVTQNGVQAPVGQKLFPISFLISYVLINYLCLMGFNYSTVLSYYTVHRKIFSSIISLSLSNVLFMIYFMIFLYEQWSSFIITILWPLSLIFIICSRIILIRTKLFVPNHTKNKTIIIGAGEAGTLIAGCILQHPEFGYNPVGFIDDDPKKQKIKIKGLPVLGKKSDLKNLIRYYEISFVIIAMPSVPRSEINDIVNLCKRTSVNLKFFSEVLKLKSKKTINIHNINIKDLIGREMIQPTDRIKDYIRDKSVLVTGAGGSIGSELVTQVAKFNPRCLILLGHGENSIFNINATLVENFPQIKFHLVIADIQDKHHIDQIFLYYKPEIVFHAAAHKHVPLMEINEGAAVRNNIFGTKNLVRASDRFGVERFVFISTDKAVQPINIMGKTKRIGELIVQSISEKSLTKFSIVRFGNVLESRGSVIPIFKKQIESGGPLTVTHPDMVRYFMTIPEAVQLVLEAGALSNGGEVFVLDMGEPIKIVDLAKNLIRLSGYEPDRDILIEFTGVRAGEKLYESLFYDCEEIETTNHPHVVIAIPRIKNIINLEQYLEELKKATMYNPDQIGTVVNQIIQNDIENRK